MTDVEELLRIEAAVQAVHRAICETSLDDCMEYLGPCVKAVRALLDVSR